jgi:hypothetical protein
MIFRGLMFALPVSLLLWWLIYRLGRVLFS